VCFGGVQFESWLSCQLSWQKYFTAFLNLSRWVTAGAVPEMCYLKWATLCPFLIGHNGGDALDLGWRGRQCDFQLQCELSTLYFPQSVDANIMSVLQYAINLFLLHACLIPFMIIYLGYGTCFSFGRVSLPGYYYLYKDQCWYSVASVCQVIAWWLLHHCQLSLIPPGHFWK
jgi:hypothetical protein